MPVSDDLKKLRIELIPPAILKPGLVEIYITLEYQFGARTVPDRTDVVAYRLLPAD